MDICLTPDDSIAENAVHVAADIDIELLTALKSSDFDIVIEPLSTHPGLRMSPSLVDRICEWVALRRLVSPDRRSSRDEVYPL